MREMKLGVIGGGVVGKAIARSYLEHVAEVRIFDVEETRKTHNLVSTLQCDIIFVCLPTPQKKDSLECDLTFIHGFFSQVQGMACNFVLRSTVPIGTTRHLADTYKLPNLVHSPEFLTARVAYVDAAMPARNIIGGYYDVVQGEYGPTHVRNQCAKLLEELYRLRFPSTPIIKVTSNESEAIKLFINGFYAVKVAYWNEVRTLADARGMNWPAIMEGVLSDDKIHPSHTKVPGPDGKMGFGGECLPKDLASLISHGLYNGVCNAAHVRNRIDRQREV